MSSRDDDESAGQLPWLILLGVAVLVFGYWIYKPGLDPTATLFQGLAFLGLIVTILLQRQELILQRKELRRTREQVAGQREALERQERVMTQQRYEDSFFRLLASQQDLVRSFRVHWHTPRRSGQAPIHMKLARERSYEGRQSFVALEDMLRKLWQARQSEGDRELFDKVFSLYSSDLTQYTQSVRETIRFLSESDLDDRERLGRLFRAQFSPSEIVLLFYIVNFRPELSDAQPWMAEVALFSDLRPEDMLEESHLGLHPIT